MISAALLVLFRWELVAAGAGMATNGVYRLAGAIVACGQRTSPPVALDCEPK